LNSALEAAKEHQVFGQVNSHRLNTTAFSAIQADLLVPGAIQRLIEATQPDWVIHCAALANVDLCETDPQQAQQLNSEVPRELAHYVARGGARLVHVSTDAVFDGQAGNYTEEDVPHPLGVYARSKLAGEQAVAEANPQAIIARVNLFGWSLFGKRSLAEFFFNNLSAGKHCMGFTDVFFCPMLANDLGIVFLKMLEAGLSGLYHTVGSQCLSKYEFGIQVARRFGFDEQLVIPTSVQDSGLKAARSPDLRLRTEKLEAALGEPLPNISTGLEKFYRQYQQGYPQQIRRFVRSESGA
jgi:dTDP-4-dehydrorhamnose reductase